MNFLRWGSFITFPPKRIEVQRHQVVDTDAFMERRGRDDLTLL
jgi:hypothetical protein